MQDFSTASVLLGRRIAKMRRKLQISQETLADRANLHRTAIGFVERGERTVTLRTLLALCTGLGTTASTLLSGIEKEIESMGKTEIRQRKRAATSERKRT
ncbi:MAG: helix-turn-helix domain-containing protein [Acidobacteriales bacterium]|nr:helix-turn-helix domain-containing protein [Terriglobales bacterium]